MIPRRRKKNKEKLRRVNPNIILEKSPQEDNARPSSSSPFHQNGAERNRKCMYTTQNVKNNGITGFSLLFASLVIFSLS